MIVEALCALGYGVRRSHSQCFTARTAYSYTRVGRASRSRANHTIMDRR